jgi:predicted RNase H-like HicB family nuclease
VHRDPGSDFGVSFPDFPGCITAGATLDEAVALAHEALALHLDGLADTGQAPPDRPAELRDLERLHGRDASLVAIVPVAVEQAEPAH